MNAMKSITSRRRSGGRRRMRSAIVSNSDVVIKLSGFEFTS